MESTFRRRGWSAKATALALLAAAGCGGGQNKQPEILPDAGRPSCGARAFLTKEGTCQCLPAYTGAACDKCASGYLKDASGRCNLPASCATEGEGWCGRGACQTGASPVCVCDLGYAGARCEACASGYQWDAAGACSPIPDCTDPSGRWSCAHGSCDRGSPGTCACETGWEGVRCDRCTAGYRLVDGRCLHEDCATLQVRCEGHGTCADAPAGMACECQEGYLPLDGGHCVPAHGSSCDDPQILDLSTGYLESSTLGGGTMEPPACFGAGQELLSTRVIRFTLPTPQRVSLGVLSGGMLLATAVDSCSAGAAASGKCAWASMEYPLEVDLAAGDHFLLVQGIAAASATSFAVQARIACPVSGQVFAWALQRCVADPCASDPCRQDRRHVCVPQPDGTAACECDAGSRAAGEGEPCLAAAPADGGSCQAALPLSVGRGQKIVASGLAATTEDAESCDSRPPGGTLYFGLYLAERSRVRLYVASPDGLAVSVRRRCEQTTSELLCQADVSNFGLGGAPALTGAVLEAGDYAVLVHGVAPSDSVTLDYTVQPDPCAAALCAAGQVREPSVDWASCSCACPEGLVFDGAACVDDPCEPNPCTGAASRCVLDAALAATCQCPVGTLPGAAAGTCDPDPAAAEWTVLVYESLDNNLGDFGGTGFKRLAVTSADPVDVVWLAAFPDSDATLYHVGHGRSAETLGFWDAPDMGSYRTLRDFLALAAKYPARHYALVIADHGGGLEFSWDSGYADTFISVPDGGYARALAPTVRRLGMRLDVVDFEACLMARWEIAEATRPFARSLLGSPQVSYDLLAGAWANAVAKDPTLPLADLGRAVAALHTMEIESWIDLDAAGAVTERLSTLADAMRARLDLCPQFDRLEQGCFAFDSGTGDLAGYCRNLAGEATLPQGIRDGARSVADAVTAAVSVNQPGTGGLGIYLPPMSMPADATDLERALDPAWTGPGAVWLPNASWDELLSACRQR
ncbi:MAG TPA: clostripain-related cysteine peptidase [Myxococcales bacterium]|jgi:hypothetical protein